MPRIPAQDARLCDLPLPDLGPRAREQLARLCTFLYVVNRPEIQARAILAGYTPEIHAQGAFHASVVSGERSFGEWRMWRSLRPPRDPDLPELVAELERFVDRWRPRVTAAVAAVADADDRGELETYFEYEFDRPSRTWHAKAWVASVEKLEKVPMPFYQDTWAALVAQGIAAELPRFHEVLATVQRFIAEAPLDEEELAEMQEWRESGAEAVEAWLKERRTQLEGCFGEETLTLLALGEAVPPPLPAGVGLGQLARFRAAARA